MRARWVLSALTIALAVGAGCGPKVKPGLGVVGDKTTARFDRAMVTGDKLGVDVADPPMRLKPTVPGKFRWLDPRTLAFVADDPLPRSTRFEVEAPAGTAALDGVGLPKAVKWSFETERLRVTLGSPGRWATPDQRISVGFNQPVRRRDVEKRCAYVADGKRVAAVVDSTGESEETRDGFVALPHEPLALATKWRFECSPELTGAEGPLGLEAPPKEDAAHPSHQVAFETFGPLKVTSVEPRGHERSPDEASIVITFSNPIAATAAALPIKVQPAIEGFPERAAVVDDRVSYTVRALQPNTRYTITVDAAVADRFGQRMAGPFVAEFGTGDGTPRLDVETGAWVVEATRAGYPAWARNLTSIEADITAVPEAKLGELAGQLDWWDQEVLDAKKVGLKTKHVTIPIKGRKNQWDQIQIEPAKLLGGSAAPAGFYYIALRAPEEPHPGVADPPPREMLLNFTNLGVTAKLAGPSGLVWVTRLSDGQPQPGAEVAIRDGKGKVRWRGTTDADGIVVTPGQAQLLPKQKVAQRNRPAGDDADEADGGGDGFDGEGDFAGRRSADLLVFARLGKDATWVNPERTGGLAAWNFRVPVDTSARAEQLRGFLHTDRGLYRPGDTVRVKGLARVMKLGSALRVPASRKAHVTVRDPRGEQLLEKNVPISRFGGFAVDVLISEGARLGDYRVEASMPEGVFHERFSVEQYRAASFEVKVAQPAREPVAGDELKLTAEARYLYGAPLRGGSLVWRVHRRSRPISFAKLPGYDFADARQWESWYDSRSGASEPLVGENEQRLDKNGRGKLSLKLKKEDFQTAQDIMVTAEVQDETHQTIAANVAIPAHQAGLYFGIDRGSPIGQAKGARNIKIVSVDPKGNRIAATGTFKVVRHDWTCAWEAWGYRGSYRCEKKDGEVMRQAIDIGPDAPAEIKFAPPGSGQYELLVEGKDAGGNATAAATYFYSWGDDDGSWQANDNERFDIIVDKPTYKVGDTARLLLKTTLRNATGLLTIERDGVIEKRLFTVGAGTSTIEVPIKDNYGPNVYASAMLVKGRTGKGGRGMPVIRMGMTTLTVDTEAKRLKVEVVTDKPSYRPGETVTADVKVTDGAGKPVQAEVALSAADEGVLTLIAFKTPDPLSTFYAAWGLGVTTASQYERIAHLPEPGEERYATGGDGAGAPGTFRSRFLATAYWNPRIETGADGHAKVTFQAPDNLTAYRLMAVAADGGERFGSGDKRMTVRKPLQLLSAMPRFLNVGDEVKAGVLVVNDTGTAGSVAVDATVTGARLRGGAHQEVALPANGRAPVLFPLRAERAGELKLRVKAVLGAETDGLELRIPVHYPARVETELVAEGHTSNAAEIPVKLPTGIMPASASLEVSTDPDGVAGLEEGLRDLIEYPYGCLEQTTSRLIPLVAVEELAKSLKLSGLDGPALQKYIRAGLAKLERFQTEEGGFSLWVGGQPEPYLTAFALWGLKVASDAGHKLPPGMIDRGTRYLRAQLGHDGNLAEGVHSELGELGSRAFAVHVLGMLDSPDPGYANKLLERKAELPRFGEAFLARALALNLGAQHPAVTGLLDDLVRAAEPKGASAIIREPGGQHLHWYMSDDVRTTAIATDAFLDLRPSDPMLPRLVRGLFGERQQGRWQTTQDNLYALVALTHYVKARPTGSVSVDATLGDEKVLAGDFRGKNTHIRRASVALDASKPPAAPLTIRASGGEVFYSTVLRFRRDVAHQKPYENKLTVRREYLDPATDAPIDPRKGVKVGGVVRVRVTVSSPEWRNHVAVDDPVPAGLEPLNTKLATSGGGPKTDGRRRRGELSDVDDDYYWRPSFREMRDDRVLVFIDRLYPGPVSFDYLARATTVGTFVVPGTSAEEMYQPEIAARTVPGTFVVKE